MLRIVLAVTLGALDALGDLAEATADAIERMLPGDRGEQGL